MVKRIESENLIIKSNELVEANYRLTVGEQKILQKLITSITKDDEDFKKYRFSVSEFMDLIDSSSKKTYKTVQQITYSLLGKRLSIYDRDKRMLIQATWLASAVYFDGEGFVDLCFAPDLKPYLLKLKECFTQYDISNVMQLRSAYSIRIYELLKQYELIGSRQFEITELRKKLGFEENEYKLYADFKRYVILQAQKELNAKTDIYFDFEEIKGSRKKVIAIKFLILSNEKKNQPDDVTIIIEMFKNKYKATLDAKLTQKMIDKKGIEYIILCLDKYAKYAKNRFIKNIAGDFYTLVMDNYENPVGQLQFHNFKQREYTEDEFDKYIFNVK